MINKYNLNIVNIYLWVFIVYILIYIIQGAILRGI